MASNSLIVLLLLLRLCQCYSEEAHLTPDLATFLEKPMSLGDEVTTSDCNFFVTTNIDVDNDLYNRLAESSKGITLISHRDMAAVYGSGMKSILSGSSCALLVINGSTMENTTEWNRIFHRVPVAMKILVIVAEHNELEDRNNWSFDTVILSHRIGSTPTIICQRLGDFTLRKTSLQISYAINFPFIVSSGGSIAGPDIKLLGVLQDKLGFSYRLKWESNYGRILTPNGTYVGMLESMRHRESDMAICELLQSWERFHYAALGFPTYFLEFPFVSALPKRTLALDVVVRPADWTVWLLVGACLAAVVGAMVLIDGGGHAFVDFMLAYGVLLQLNIPSRWINLPSLKSRSLLVAVWLIWSSFLAMAYRSVLLTSLSFVEYEKPIETIADVLDSDLPYLVPSQTLGDIVLRTSSVPIMRKLYDEAVLGRHGLYSFNGTFPSWVQPMLESGLAVTTLSRFQADPAVFHLSKTNVFADHTHLLFVKGSRIASLVDRYVSFLKCNGILEKWLQDQVRHSFLLAGSGGRNEGPSLNRDAVIKLDEVFPALIILGAGLLIGILIFATELTFPALERIKCYYYCAK